MNPQGVSSVGLLDESVGIASVGYLHPDGDGDVVGGSIHLRIIRDVRYEEDEIMAVICAFLATR